MTFDALILWPRRQTTFSQPVAVFVLTKLQVTFLAPANDAWDRYNNFRDDFQDSSLVDVDDNEGSRTLREQTYLYHFLIGSFEQFSSDRVLPTNLAPPDWTRVAGGAVVKYFHDENTFLSGMGHLSEFSLQMGLPMPFRALLLLMADGYM